MPWILRLALAAAAISGVAGVATGPSARAASAVTGYNMTMACQQVCGGNCINQLSFCRSLHPAGPAECQQTHDYCLVRCRQDCEPRLRGTALPR